MARLANECIWGSDIPPMFHPRQNLWCGKGILPQLCVLFRIVRCLGQDLLPSPHACGFVCWHTAGEAG